MSVIIDLKRTYSGTSSSNTTVNIGLWTPSLENPVVANTNLRVRGLLMGRVGLTAAVSIEASSTFLVNGGTVTQSGTQTSLMAPQGDASLTACAIVIDTNADIIRLRATGIAATNIVWTGWLWINSGSF